MSANALAESAKALTSSDVQELPWEHLHDVQEAVTKVLWRSGQSLAGILRLEGGASLGRHVHSNGEHHAYVLEGRCLFDSKPLPAGSYIHVPRGTRHEVVGDQPDGCRILYFFMSDEG
jgi:quercetin dioxygenase-like cupin family protein